MTDSRIATIDRMIVALESCANKLESLGRTFSGRNFTDRYGDGPVCLGLARHARAMCDEARETTVSEIGACPLCKQVTTGEHCLISVCPRKETLPSATAPIDKLSALMMREDADFSICPPGNHGGRGNDAKRWLVTIEPSDHNRIREFFGDTLEEAINYAVR